uniref:Uncharacterized protein n=1 Tax=mine drainage metagenome TaxID=410659 RepID=E6Q523_9ZZZZ
MYRSAEQAYSWTAPNGNNGSLIIQGDQALVFSTFFAHRTGNYKPVIASLASTALARGPKDVAACNLAAWAVLVAYLGVGISAFAAGGELFLNPLADAGLVVALIGYGISLGTLWHDCV